jgi:hypothetical protein
MGRYASCRHAEWLGVDSVDRPKFSTENVDSVDRSVDSVDRPTFCPRAES